jgi:Fur family ferric uptake transcriptional regulator
MISRIEQICLEKGLKMTDQRRVIARVLSEATDHPDVEGLYQRAAAVDSRISIATVYRTVKLWEEANILERHDFGDGRARYEEAPEVHHDHLIDMKTGEVIELLVGHRLELYGTRLKPGGKEPDGQNER